MEARFERSLYQPPRARSPPGSADLLEILSVFGNTCEYRIKQERVGKLANPGPALSHSSLLYLPFFLSLRKWF